MHVSLSTHMIYAGDSCIPCTRTNNTDPSHLSSVSSSSSSSHSTSLYVVCGCQKNEWYVCMHVCARACMHTCAYVCMHACMHACVCMPARMHACESAGRRSGTVLRHELHNGIVLLLHQHARTSTSASMRSTYLVAKKVCSPSRCIFCKQHDRCVRRICSK